MKTPSNLVLKTRFPRVALKSMRANRSCSCEDRGGDLLETPQQNMASLQKAGASYRHAGLFVDPAEPKPLGGSKSRAPNFELQYS